MRSENPFEVRAKEYDAWFDEHPGLYESEVLAVRATLPEAPGRWVEVGVGTGRFASRLGIAFGVEPSAAMANLARARGVDVIEGKAERLPFADSSVDAVFFITTLCFVADVSRALAEARRVLVPGGAIVVAFLPRESELGRRIAADPSDPFFNTARLLSTSELLTAVTRAGFRIVRILQTLTHSGASEAIEAPTEGFGRGSFVVVRGARQD